MALEYRTSDGDTADYIAFRHYGTTDHGVVEKLLQANPGLADRGPLLPPNVMVILPEIDTTDKVQGVRLWD